MKKLFQAIRKGELPLVKDIISKNSDLVNCVAKQPPKKDDGQSPLQVALKCGQFEIANYLLDSGANVNFIDTESVNEWKMPVVHDAICAAINCSRWLKHSYGRDSDGNLIKNYDTFVHTMEEANASYDILKRMIDMGAQINCKDSKGNWYSGLNRAILDARQILPHKTDTAPPPVNKELVEDFTRIFQLLLSNGADPNEPCLFGDEMTLIEYYGDEEVARFMK